MRAQKILNSNLVASVICLGTVNIGSTLDQKSSFALLDAYLEQGGNFIDSAKVYSDWLPGEKSSSEKMIGHWLKERKNRNQVIVATKGAHPELASMHLSRLTPKEIVSDISASLINLQTDFIDLYWLHRDDLNQPVSEIIDTLLAQVKLGRIRYFGCSNWCLERIKAAQDYAKQKGVAGFVANQPYWSLAEVNVNSLSDKTLVVLDQKTKQFHQESNLSAIPYSSQANGWFQKMATNTVSPQLYKIYNNRISEERYNRVKALSAETNLTITQIVLGYLISQPFPTFPIIGARSVAMLNDSLSASNIRLTTAQMDFLES